MAGPGPIGRMRYARLLLLLFFLGLLLIIVWLLSERMSELVQLLVDHHLEFWPHHLIVQYRMQEFPLALCVLGNLIIRLCVVPRDTTFQTASCNGKLERLATHTHTGRAVDNNKSYSLGEAQTTNLLSTQNECKASHHLLQSSFLLLLLFYIRERQAGRERHVCVYSRTPAPPAPWYSIEEEKIQ
jgi:hypothetical protein